MKLAKAIEIGELNVKMAGKKMPADCLDSIKLLIEAGKRIYLQREHPKRKFNTLLSGETNE